MSLQMVQYKCSNLHYPGDEKIRKNTQMNKKKHGASNIGLIECDDHIKKSPIRNTLMKKNHEEQKRQGYALEI
jgi:hypothetical protein